MTEGVSQNDRGGCLRMTEGGAQNDRERAPQNGRERFPFPLHKGGEVGGDSSTSLHFAQNDRGGVSQNDRGRRSE